MFNFLIFMISFFGGIIIYAFGILQVLITVFCTIPLTRTLSQVYDINKSRIYKISSITIAFWSILSAVVITAMFLYTNGSALIGFGIGGLVAFFVSLGKWGVTENNCNEYIKNNAKYFEPSSFECFLNDMSGNEDLLKSNENASQNL